VLKILQHDKIWRGQPPAPNSGTGGLVPLSPRDLRPWVIALDLGGGRRLWRQEAGSKMLLKKSRERSSLREANELRFAQYNMEEYGIPRVKL